MFDYPLPIPRNTLYDELGLDPEATVAEIRDAIAERHKELRAEQVRVKTEQSRIYDAVPGLREAEEQVAALRLENASGKPTDREVRLRAARSQLDELEQRALALNPEFIKLRERAEQLKKQDEALNILPLLNVENRLEYDRAHPPLELFKLANCERNELFDRERANIALTALRRELSAFLEEQGEIVFHPSDLTRQDFSNDFEYIPLLDGAAE